VATEVVWQKRNFSKNVIIDFGTSTAPTSLKLCKTYPGVSSSDLHLQFSCLEIYSIFIGDCTFFKVQFPKIQKGDFPWIFEKF